MSINNKIIKPVGQEPDALELKIAQCISDMEKNITELKADLKGLQFSAAKELEIGHGRKAIVIFVPVPLLKQFQKVQSRLIRELEKKFSDSHVLLVAQRRIMQKPAKGSRVKQARPRSRTLIQVHENILEDIVYPTEIVGKRTKIKVDGSKIIKIFLDKKDSTYLEYKLETFSTVYKKLTGKEAIFEFPVSQE
ncbi:ribosomal protein S7e [Piromyces finnis]|uniref:40S ribosomal protein S7 n=1 Tax=Piromyces finnis TaxID=1754191 RepID=A0A1Y1V5S4_9FUNG|nr:ribosomal protein S7e [Piromyces finnis]|eukprot:ORX47870.1 ribosomal protein S7e [Piromyces finnis]